MAVYTIAYKSKCAGGNHYTFDIKRGTTVLRQITISPQDLETTPIDVDEMARLVKERDHVGNKIRAMIPVSQRDKLNPLAHETKVKSAVKEDSGKDKSTMAKLNDLYDQVHTLNKQIDEVKKGKPEDKGSGPKGGGGGGGSHR